MIGFLNLCARRGDRLVLDDARIEIPTGTVTGLVAPNGSGKTTLLESIYEPWSGHVTCKIDGGNTSVTRNPSAVEWKRVVFYLPSPSVLSLRATVRQNIEFARDCWESQVDVAKLSSRLGIEGFLDLPVRKCSQGMAQLASIATAMATGADLLLFDEPMSALDPTNVGTVTRAMRSYVRTGRSIVLSSHNLANVDLSCDRVAFIVNKQVELHDRARGRTDTCAARYHELYEKGGNAPAH